jgi:zinc-binding alcohol dehydrogenase family protein
MIERMRAVAYTSSRAVDDPQSLVDVELDRPQVGPHDLLVEVRAVSVNPVDVKQRSGADPGGEARVLGFDAAGIVREIGPEATLFAAGDEVFYAGSRDRPGTDAELHAVDERVVGHKPASVGFAQAAALPLTSIAAWEGLFDKLRLTRQSTGTLLVVGASGGVGSMVLQIVKAVIPGVRVIATAGRPEAEEWVRSLGADETVNHRRGLGEEVLRVAPDGVDWIFSTHSEGQVEVYAQLLKPFGEIVAIDDPETVDVVALKEKSLSWHWELMFTRPVHRTADLERQHAALEEVSELVDAGRIRTTATTVLRPLDAARLREAHRMVEDGHMIGKVVIERGDEPA